MLKDFSQKPDVTMKNLQLVLAAFYLLFCAYEMLCTVRIALTAVCIKTENILVSKRKIEQFLVGSSDLNYPY